MWCMLLSGFFVFKQKTSYEMRISDWSSDVCSSDLHRALLGDRQFWKTQFDIAQRQLSLRAIELPGKAPEQITENMKNAQRQMSADHEKQAHDQSLNTFRRTCSPCTSEESRFEPGISEVWRSPATPANPAYERSSRTATRLAARRPPQPRRPRARSRPINVGASTCATGVCVPRANRLNWPMRSRTV